MTADLLMTNPWNVSSFLSPGTKTWFVSGAEVPMNQIYSTTSAMISASSCGRISCSHAARSVPGFLRHELDDDPVRVSGIRFIRRFGEVGSRTEREEAQASPLACNLGFVPFVRPPSPLTHGAHISAGNNEGIVWRRHVILGGSQRVRLCFRRISAT